MKTNCALMHLIFYQMTLKYIIILSIFSEAFKKENIFQALMVIIQRELSKTLN